MTLQLMHTNHLHLQLLPLQTELHPRTCCHLYPVDLASPTLLKCLNVTYESREQGPGVSYKTGRKRMDTSC